MSFQCQRCGRVTEVDPMDAEDGEECENGCWRPENAEKWKNWRRVYWC